ncbi:MAG: hypothetical protein H7834_09965 [Magnetococcus sp. YQC-9]
MKKSATKNLFAINYSVGVGEVAVNAAGTGVEVVSRADMFLTVNAAYHDPHGMDMAETARADRQVEFIDETMPTAIKKKEEVFVEYEVYKIYPNWDTEKKGTDWYIDRKPKRIVYKVRLVFVDPRTGSEAGNAGYEYRTETFTVQPPTGNFTKMPDEKSGTDPGDRLWG